MGWRGYIDTSRETVFFWSQKAACTTLFNLLADNMPRRPESKKYFHTESASFHRCLDMVQGRGFRSVILVRHPVTRAISAYFNKFCLYRDQVLRSRDDLEPFAQDLHDRFRALRGTPPGTSDANEMTFEDFLFTLEDLFAARETPETPLNGHWDTQMPAFLHESGFRYDHVLHVEAFDAEMGALAQELGLVFHRRRMNRTETARWRRPGYLGQLPAREVATRPFGYGNFITLATLRRMHRLYDVDFEAFRYPPEPADTPLGLRLRGMARGLRDRIRAG